MASWQSVSMLMVLIQIHSITSGSVGNDVTKRDDPTAETLLEPNHFETVDGTRNVEGLVNPLEQAIRIITSEELPSTNEFFEQTSQNSDSDEILNKSQIDKRVIGNTLNLENAIQSFINSRFRRESNTAESDMVFLNAKNADESTGTGNSRPDSVVFESDLKTPPKTSQDALKKSKNFDDVLKYMQYVNDIVQKNPYTNPGPGLTYSKNLQTPNFSNDYTPSNYLPMVSLAEAHAQLLKLPEIDEEMKGLLRELNQIQGELLQTRDLLIQISTLRNSIMSGYSARLRSNADGQMSDGERAEMAKMEERIKEAENFEKFLEKQYNSQASTKKDVTNRIKAKLRQMRVSDSRAFRENNQLDELFNVVLNDTPEKSSSPVNPVHAPHPERSSVNRARSNNDNSTSNNWKKIMQVIFEYGKEMETDKVSESTFPMGRGAVNFEDSGDDSGPVLTQRKSMKFRMSDPFSSLINIFDQNDDLSAPGSSLQLQMFKHLGLLAIVPSILFKLVNKAVYFLQLLKTNKYVKLYLMPLMIAMGINGLMVFLVWWLFPEDCPAHQVGQLAVETPMALEGFGGFT